MTTQEEHQVFQGSLAEIIKEVVDSDNPNKMGVVEGLAFIMGGYGISSSAKAIITVPTKPRESGVLVRGAIKDNNEVTVFETEVSPEDHVAISIDTNLLKRLLEE